MKITEVECLNLRLPSAPKLESLVKKSGLVGKRKIPKEFPYFSANFFMVKVSTDENICGFSYGWIPREYVESTIKPYLLGKEPFIIEQLPTFFPWDIPGIDGASYWALIEHALWDIIGKVSKQPLCKILGGEKEKVRAYVTCIWGNVGDESDVDPKQQAKDLLRYVEKGYKGVKIRAWRPNPDDIIGAVKQIRDIVGGDLAIMLDRTAHFPGETWSLSTALKVARGLQKYDVDWLEEPLDRNDLDGAAELSSSVDIPIAGGEGEHELWRFREILEKRTYDIIQPDAYTTGGVLAVRKIAALTEAFGKPCILHGNRGPSLAVALQLAGSIRSCSWAEIAVAYPPLMPEEMWEHLTPLFRNDPLIKIEKGMVHIPDKPGLGLEPNEDIISKYRTESNISPYD